jgi:hypothetical protein
LKRCAAARVVRDGRAVPVAQQVQDLLAADRPDAIGLELGVPLATVAPFDLGVSSPLLVHFRALLDVEVAVGPLNDGADERAAIVDGNLLTLRASWFIRMAH